MTPILSRAQPEIVDFHFQMNSYGQHHQSSESCASDTKALQTGSIDIKVVPSNLSITINHLLLLLVMCLRSFY